MIAKAFHLNKRVLVILFRYMHLSAPSDSNKVHLSIAENTYHAQLVYCSKAKEKSIQWCSTTKMAT